MTLSERGWIRGRIKYSYLSAPYANKREGKEFTMKISKQTSSGSAKKKRLHRWDRLVKIVKWLVEHQVPQTIIKLIIWLWNLLLEG